MAHKVCGSIDPKTGQRCTKRPGHYHPVRSRHSCERPGYESAWDEPDTEQKEKVA